MVFPIFRQSAGGTKNSKSQITNIKQITMTKIVRASLGLPTLRAGSPEDQYWNLRFFCNLVLGVWDFIDSSIPKELATFNGKAMQLCPPHKVGTVRLFSDEFFYCCQYRIIVRLTGDLFDQIHISYGSFFIYHKNRPRQ